MLFLSNPKSREIRRRKGEVKEKGGLCITPLQTRLTCFWITRTKAMIKEARFTTVKMRLYTRSHRHYYIIPLKNRKTSTRNSNLTTRRRPIYHRGISNLRLKLQFITLSKEFRLTSLSRAPKKIWRIWKTFNPRTNFISNNKSRRAYKMVTDTIKISSRLSSSV